MPVTSFHRKFSKRVGPHLFFPGGNACAASLVRTFLSSFWRSPLHGRSRKEENKTDRVSLGLLSENRNRGERPPFSHIGPYLAFIPIAGPPIRREHTWWSHLVQLEIMPSKGHTQKKMTDLQTLTDIGGTHAQGPIDVDGDIVCAQLSQEKVNLGGTKRAKWSHQMKVFLIDLLKDHDVPGFRTQNAWSKEAWNNIVCHLNAKFGTFFTVSQVKQKGQDLKKDYRIVKDLVDQSGFGWNNERMMVEAPENVWASFAARKNNEASLSWKDKSFPYYNDLFKLYDGRYAEGRTHQGMDHYANRSKNASVPAAQAVHLADTYQSPSPTLNGLDESGLQFHFDEEMEEENLDFFQRSSAQVPPS